MSKPSTAQIARALGVSVSLVGQLAKRGMPTRAMDQARAWFDEFGTRNFNHRPHSGRRWIKLKGQG